MSLSTAYPAPLEGASVYGSVLVEGGTLTADNGTRILGGVQVSSGGNVTLEDVSVLDEVKLQQSGDLSVNGSTTTTRISVKDSGNVTIGPHASTGEVQLENSGDITVRGSVASLLTKGSGGIKLTDAKVFPGGVTVSLSNGTLEICGSQIGGTNGTPLDGSGGVYVLESGPVLAVADASCAASQIEGAVIVKKGTGPVRFVGATLNSDLIVTERVGNVEVDGSGCDPLESRCGTVSDINLEKLTGDVTLNSVWADSDTTVVDNDGSVTIDSSTFASDVRIRLNTKTVKITKSSFSLEDVLIAKNDGPVIIDSNCDARPTIVENSHVMIINNKAENAIAAGATCTSGFGFSDADVSKNSSGVLIENNTGEGLYCTDNDPAPTDGRGNLITFSDGQCAGF